MPASQQGLPTGAHESCAGKTDTSPSSPNARGSDQRQRKTRYDKTPRKRCGCTRRTGRKVGGASPPKRRSNQTTFLREPCVGPREGAGEASVAVRMGRAIEHRKRIDPGCRGFQIGRRQHRRHRFGEMSADPAVSENPCTFARLVHQRVDPSPSSKATGPTPTSTSTPAPSGPRIPSRFDIDRDPTMQMTTATNSFLSLRSRTRSQLCPNTGPIGPLTYRSSPPYAGSRRGPNATAWICGVCEPEFSAIGIPIRGRKDGGRTRRRR